MFCSSATYRAVTLEIMPHTFPTVGKSEKKSQTDDTFWINPPTFDWMTPLPAPTIPSFRDLKAWIDEHNIQQIFLPYECALIFL